MASDMEKIFIDASQEAEITFSDGSAPVRCLTLQEAVIEFGTYEAAKKKIATIAIKGGQRFDAEQVERLHHK